MNSTSSVESASPKRPGGRWQRQRRWMLVAAIAAAVATPGLIDIGVADAASVSRAGDFRISGDLVCGRSSVKSSVPVVQAARPHRIWSYTELFDGSGRRVRATGWRWSDVRGSVNVNGFTNYGLWFDQSNNRVDFSVFGSVSPGWYLVRDNVYVDENGDGKWEIYRTLAIASNGQPFCLAG